jgi:hypothetical protein
MSVSHHTCVADPLEAYLVNRALVFGRDRKGMPGWRVVVERIGILLENPDHPAWWEAHRGREAVAKMPRQVKSTYELQGKLLSTPSTLPLEVLEWLSDHFFCCASPPYSGRFDRSSDSPLGIG